MQISKNSFIRRKRYEDLNTFNSNKLSVKAIKDFQKVYYEVMGKVIPYEFAEEEANRFMRILVLTFPSDKIRTMKMQIAWAKSNTKDSKMRKS